MKEYWLYGNGGIKMGKVIGFIGGGNMAEGIISGLLASKAKSTSEILVKEILEERKQYLNETYGVKIIEETAELANQADILILAVRPQDAESVSLELSNYIKEGKIVVSICAGIQIVRLNEWLGSHIKLARIMPNTMIQVKKGYSALAFGDGFNKEEKADVQVITDAIGKTLILPESQFDAFTALGCAGAEWIILFAAALTDAGVETGISRENAKKIVYENLEAVGRMLATSNKHPYQITDEMNTPGGIGIAGFHSFQSAGLGGIVMDAVGAAYKRTVELG